MWLQCTTSYHWTPHYIIGHIMTVVDWIGNEVFLVEAMYSAHDSTVHVFLHTHSGKSTFAKPCDNITYRRRQILATSIWDSVSATGRGMSKFLPRRSANVHCVKHAVKIHFSLSSINDDKYTASTECVRQTIVWVRQEVVHRCCEDELELYHIINTTTNITHYSKYYYINTLKW